MNINASYNWIKEYLKTDLSAEEFAKMTTAAGNGVEQMERLADRYHDMVIGEVAKVSPHPDADKLRLAQVKIGAMKKVEIVCGGANLAEGQKVVVALPGAHVRWHGEGDWVQLTETEIRGVKSHGMICAANEVGFPDLPQGDKDIWDVTDLVDAKAGTAVAEALEIDDVMMDIEVTTNRPDAMSIVGQAREGSAVTGAEFAWKAGEIDVPEGAGPLDVKILDYDLCRKYEAVMIEDVKVGPSPWWLQKKLLLAGFRPINNVVDVTNYVLHELGQPMHAFDAEKLNGGIQIRRAKTGETIKALDGNDYELTDKMLVIADRENPIAIAGVMGGEESGTTEGTTRIILESATFEPVSVRRTSRALNLASNSSQLFEKGLSTMATRPALSRAVELILEIAGGTVVSQVWSDQAAPFEAPQFAFDPEKAQALIGVPIPEEEMTGMLTRLGFELKEKGDTYDVSVPYWRDHDIEDSRDFVEEIARLYGYENIPATLPSGEISFVNDPMLDWERRVKELLRGAGLTETYSYTFVSEQQLERYGLSADDAVKIQNPLSEDHSFMRPSLVPGMLSSVEENQRQFPSAKLFEIAPVYLPAGDSHPEHHMRLLAGVYGKDGYANFREAKGILERLMREGGIRQWRLERLAGNADWHEGRSAKIMLQDVELGVIGEVAHARANAFGLEPRVVLIDLDFEVLVEHLTTAKSYTAIPQFPEVKRDLAMVVEEKTAFAEIEHKMKAGSELLREVELFDIYRGKGVNDGKKSLAMHLTFRLADRTLEAEEVDQEMTKLRSMLENEFSAIMRS